MASSKNPKKTGIEAFLNDILDPQDIEVFATRGKGCEIIFSNEKARNRIYADAVLTYNCKTSIAKSLPGICDYCPYGGKTEETSVAPFEIEDTENRTHIARRDMIDWIDGKQASLFFLRDITEEKESRARLYALAYIDQLTGVPNRQRLKEDFSAMEADIANNRLTGIVALIDMDNFKTINDTYGHNTGDMVLRRLTEHLEGDKAFSGSLYRLSGDEFVLFYADAADKYSSVDEMKLHYYELLSTALCAYTLPTIEVKCTLSIGVSVFPEHGDNLSEILRKADIALYKAKAAGRNQVVYFESQYDTAQKFRDLYINIQPILTAAGKTFGYELVDCGEGGEEDDSTISLNESNRTVDALGLSEIENNMQYLITFSKQLFSPTVLNNLPREKFIVQVQLSDVLTTNKLHNDLQNCRELRRNGYKIALGGLHSNTNYEELLSLADYCKFSLNDKNTMKQKRIITANKNVKFIATKIDTSEAFQTAKDMGFHLYQGYHFSHEAVGSKTKEISPIKANYFRLLKLSSTDGYLDFREISAVIASDVALSYKLLRILNSAAVGLKNVSSISMAVAYLGEESLKKWIAVLALGGVAEDKPLELVRMSLIRARFGELLAAHLRIKRDVKNVFMAGLLSLLHIALEKTQEQFLEEIVVAEDIRESLLTKRGVYSDLLRFFENYEYANWDAVSQFVVENQLDSQLVNDAYVSAVKWYNELVE